MKRNKISTCKTALFGALLAASLLSGAHSANAAQAITFSTASDYYQNSNATNNNIIGWSFTANQDLFATRLAVFDTDRDIAPELNHYIGLWDSAGSLLASATVTETNVRPQGFAYHWADITQTTLKAGQTYTVGAIMGVDYYTAQVPNSIFNYGDPTPFGNLQVNPGISYLADAFYDLATNPVTGTVTESTNQLTFGTASIGNGLTDPNTIVGGFGANINVTPTPIPAAAWLLGSGLLGLFGFKRKDNK